MIPHFSAHYLFIFVEGHDDIKAKMFAILEKKERKSNTSLNQRFNGMYCMTKKQSSKTKCSSPFTFFFFFF